MIDFDNYVVNVDSDCIHQDFDNIDLYGNKLEESINDEYSDNFEFE